MASYQFPCQAPQQVQVNKLWPADCIQNMDVGLWQHLASEDFGSRHFPHAAIETNSSMGKVPAVPQSQS